MEQPLRDCITDVAGVQVGQVTLRDEVAGCVRTGVTAVLPSPDVTARPVPAAVHVLNGYGKPVGLVQVAELGVLEAPVLLTGTFGVGAAHEGALRWLAGRDPELGRPTTINPVVLECNDGRLHDLRTFALRPEHVGEALDRALTSAGGTPVEEGAVGAGHGMVAFGWKGGIGTASAQVCGPTAGTLGALVLTNMGQPEDLVVGGSRVPARPEKFRTGSGTAPEGATVEVDGSVVVLLATDAALDARQLGRLARRAQNGLARTGVQTDHGSGEFVLAWSTSTDSGAVVRDGGWLRPWFAGVADVVERAVLSSLRHAVDTEGLTGGIVRRCPAL